MPGLSRPRPEAEHHAGLLAGAPVSVETPGPADTLWTRASPQGLRSPSALKHPPSPAPARAWGGSAHLRGLWAGGWRVRSPAAEPRARDRKLGGRVPPPPLQDQSVGSGPASNQMTSCLIKSLTLYQGLARDRRALGRCERLSGVPLPPCPRKGTLRGRRLGRCRTVEGSRAWDSPRHPGWRIWCGERPPRPGPGLCSPAGWRRPRTKGGFLGEEGP